MANSREAAFRKAVEEIEHEMGPMSDDEFRQFKAEWRQSNPKRAKEDFRDIPVDRRQAYVNDAYKDAGKHISGAARGIGDWLSSARDKVSEAVAPGSEQGAETYESGVRGIGDWLKKVSDHLSFDDAHEGNRKEEELKRAVEHMGNKLNSALTGDSVTESLRPEYGGDEPYNETIDFDFPGRKGSAANPVKLDAVPLDMPSNEEQGIEEMPEEVGKARFHSGSHENPVRLPPIELHEDLRGHADGGDEGVRVEGLTFKIPRNRRG